MTLRATIEELRLGKFKSFQDASLPLADLTVLIGRNGSGKSNALEGLEVLARLATGADIRDALDGTRIGGGPIRGGAIGCAPAGDQEFALGCTVASGGDRFELDVRVNVAPDVQIVYERLRRARPVEGSWWRQTYRELLRTDAGDPARADIDVRWDNQKQGPNPVLPFRASRLVASQVATRLPTSTIAQREIHHAAEVVLAALGAVFVLNPVPHLMRQYVPASDIVLRREAENLSAVLGALRADEAAWKRICDLVRALPEHELADLDVESSPLGDVMVVMREHLGLQEVAFPARLMSDGILRFLAISAALLQDPTAKARVAADAVEAATTLLVEEIENGLFPSQAGRVIRLFKEEAQNRRVRSLITTHSPAMLSALEAKDHRSVAVCDRDPTTGWSRLRLLTQLPAYPAAMAAGSLGDAVVSGRLTAEADLEERLRALDGLLAEN